MSNGRVRADATAIGPDQKWSYVYTGRGKNGWNIVKGNQYVVLKSRFGKYLVAEANGVVNANRVKVGPWEKWQGMGTRV